jgi:hypothetical protein
VKQINLTPLSNTFIGFAGDTPPREFDIAAKCRDIQRLMSATGRFSAALVLSSERPQGE